MTSIDELLDELQGYCYQEGGGAGEWVEEVKQARAAVDAEIKRLLDANEALRKAQDYVYIGRDGKSVLARDLEDQLIAALAEIEELKHLDLGDAARFEMSKLQDRIAELEAKNRQIMITAKSDALLLFRYHVWCDNNGCSPSTSDLYSVQLPAVLSKLEREVMQPDPNNNNTTDTAPARLVT